MKCIIVGWSSKLFVPNWQSDRAEWSQQPRRIKSRGRYFNYSLGHRWSPARVEIRGKGGKHHSQRHGGHEQAIYYASTYIWAALYKRRVQCSNRESDPPSQRRGEMRNGIGTNLWQFWSWACVFSPVVSSPLYSLSLISQELASSKFPSLLSHSVTSKIADRKLKIDCKILEDRNFPFV